MYLCARARWRLRVVMNALVSLAAALASAVLVRIGKAGRCLFIKDK